MAGPIQTAIGQALGVATSITAIGKKVNEDKKQAAEEEGTKKDKAAAAEAESKKAAEATALKQKEEKAAHRAQLKAEKDEASSIATEADMRMLGVPKEAAQAYLLAQQRGTASPSRIIFDANGRPLATYEEMATILADESLTGTVSARLRGKNAVKNRRKLLEGKNRAEKVRNAILAEGGTTNE